MTTAELDQFYAGMVEQARKQGVTCSITSGMACVYYGIAAATKDCDILCSPEQAGALFAVISNSRAEEQPPAYRGHLSAPLDCRWLRGGWTSHFEWNTVPAPAHLDVFGIAPRGSVPWWIDSRGLFAHPHIVGEMKRTDREKDWPFATSLGLKLLAEGDLRGWLHIFDAESLTAAFERVPCPPDLIASRPALGLLVSGDPRLDVAIRGEVEFWHQLDKLRMSVHRRAVRSYMVAVGRHPDGDSLELAVQHRVRVAVAERLLPQAPLLDYGIERIIAEAISHASRLVPTGALDWLPDARKNFYGLSQ